jgi:hypothetical protein
MKKCHFYLEAVLVLCILLSVSCEKEPATSDQTLNPAKTGFMEEGRIKASQIAQSKQLSFKQIDRTLLLQTEISALKELGMSAEDLLLRNNNIASSVHLKYDVWNPCRFTQVERYASNCYLEGITYYGYNESGCLQQEDYYSDYDQDGNYTYEGSFVYTYDWANNAYTVRYVDHYNNSGDWDYYYHYFYGQTRDGHPLYNIEAIEKWDAYGNFMGYSSFTNNNPGYSRKDYNTNLALLYKREYVSTWGQLGSLTVTDANGNFSYNKTFTYDSNNNYRLVKSTVATLRTGIYFDYYYNTANADIVCYKNKNGDYFNTAWVYRVDNAQTGYFDPLDEMEYVSMKN